MGEGPSGSSRPGGGGGGVAERAVGDNRLGRVCWRRGPRSRVVLLLMRLVEGEVGNGPRGSDGGALAWALGEEGKGEAGRRDEDDGVRKTTGSHTPVKRDINLLRFIKAKHIPLEVFTFVC